MISSECVLLKIATGIILSTYHILLMRRDHYPFTQRVLSRLEVLVVALLFRLRFASLRINAG